MPLPFSYSSIEVSARTRSAHELAAQSLYIQVRTAHVRTRSYFCFVCAHVLVDRPRYYMRQLSLTEMFEVSNHLCLPHALCVFEGCEVDNIGDNASEVIPQ